MPDTSDSAPSPSSPSSGARDVRGTVSTGGRPLREKFPERLARCVAGLACFGTGIAFFVRSEMGVPPWDVFHQGLSAITGANLGVVLIAMSFVVLLLWIPLRLVPGLGTLLNAVEIGLVEMVVEEAIPETGMLVPRIAYVAIGLLLIAAGSGLYIGAELGPGPRDGLMVGISRRFGTSVRLARTMVEITVLVTGIMLGGAVGAATLVFAIGIGPLVQVMLRVFAMPDRLVEAATGEALDQ